MMAISVEFVDNVSSCRVGLRWMILVSAPKCRVGL